MRAVIAGMVIGLRQYQSQRGEARGEIAFRVDGPGGLVAVDGLWADMEGFAAGEVRSLPVDVRARSGDLVVFLRPAAEAR